MKPQTLILMLKEPRPGRVKTRLGRDIGLVQAAWWFRHQSRKMIRRLAPDARWQLVLAVTPDVEGLTSRAWPAGLPRVPQGRGDLGARMGRLLAGVPGPVVLIGADIPRVTRGHIARAFQALGSADMVFGPAEDGGFWLVGVKGRVPERLFQGVRWSTEHALADTLAGLSGTRVVLVDRMRDVDRVQDL